MEYGGMVRRSVHIELKVKYKAKQSEINSR
jgi:hypothetical protein